MTLLSRVRGRVPGLALICLIHGLLTIAYAIAIPPWEAPDEPAHYQFMAHLATTWRPPTRPLIRQTRSFSKDYPYISSNYEWYQPPLGYVPGALVYQWLDLWCPDRLPRTIPALEPTFSTTPGSATLFRHPGPTVFQVWQGSTGLLAMRIATCFLGLIVIVSAYVVGRYLKRDSHWLGVAMAGWVAFLPQFTFVNASVRSDNLVNALAALVILGSVVVVVTHSVKPRVLLLLGTLTGLAVLSKLTSVYVGLIPVSALMLITRCRPRDVLTPVALFLLPVGVIVGSYFLAYPEARSALAYVVGAEFAIKPELLTWNRMKLIPAPLLVNLFYARFGWANVGPPSLWMRTACGLWMVGVSLTLLQVWRKRNAQWSSSPAGAVAVLGLGVFLALAAVVRFNLTIYQPQGRFLFPVLVAWAALGLWGTLDRLPSRYHAPFAVVVCLGMLGFNLVSLCCYLVPAYY
jgi:4-amino-4-deoxy-L-arabinose transferase-like glycosyltransferase